MPPAPLFLLSWLMEGREGIASILSSIGWIGAGSVLYLAFVATIFGFGAWGHLLGKYPATLVAPFSLLVPVFGMASSALLLGERFGVLRTFGAVLVVVGLVLSVYRRRKAGIQEDDGIDATLTGDVACPSRFRPILSHGVSPFRLVHSNKHENEFPQNEDRRQV